jgi:hypothetical protein
MTGRAREFSEDERDKGGGEGSLFPTSSKSCLKVVSRKLLHFPLSILFLP